MNEEFKIQAYGYSELAQLYFPRSSKKSASVQLRRWIKRSKVLSEGLCELGYFYKQKILTPRQVELIIEVIGRPES